MVRQAGHHHRKSIYCNREDKRDEKAETLILKEYFP